MSTEVLVYVLTALAAVVVVLTRLRLRRDRDSGRFRISRGVVAVHTVSGVLALVVWLVFLLAPEDSTAGDDVTGIVGLALWWVVTLCGLMILMRWLPAGGKHASAAARDAWGGGPALSILAHVGMLGGVLVFTWAYLTAAV